MLLAALLAGACSTPAAPDAYDLLSASTKAAWDPLQVNVGVVIKDGDTTITIEPTAIGMVVDGAGQKSAVHMALPAETLGLDSFMLDQLGIDGDSIDVDVIYDGQRLYAKSPILGQSLRILLGPTANVPPGNLAGWLAFGSAEEFAALGNLMALPGPSLTPSAGPTGSLKSILGDIGITLTSAGTEKHDGRDALHLVVAVDTDKLFASSYFDAMTRAQIGQLGIPIKALAISADIWIDQAANRVFETDVHVASTTEPDQTGDIRVTFRDPDGSISLLAPPSSVEIPIGTLVTEMMKLLSKGAES
jgi:hypothetical protein